MRGTQVLGWIWIIAKVYMDFGHSQLNHMSRIKCTWFTTEKLKVQSLFDYHPKWKTLMWINSCTEGSAFVKGAIFQHSKPSVAMVFELLKTAVKIGLIVEFFPNRGYIIMRPKNPVHRNNLEKRTHIFVLQKHTNVLVIITTGTYRIEVFKNAKRIVPNPLK